VSNSEDFIRNEKADSSRLKITKVNSTTTLGVSTLMRTGSLRNENSKSRRVKTVLIGNGIPSPVAEGRRR
jgi:hypothetical protein